MLCHIYKFKNNDENKMIIIKNFNIRNFLIDIKFTKKIK